MPVPRPRAFVRKCFLVLASVFTLFLVTTPARAADLPEFVHDGTLTVCTNPTLPPMTFVNGTDATAMAGVDMDLARALARYWNVKLVTTPMDFVGLFPSLAAQRCGMVISGIIKLPEREKNFDAITYLDTALVVVARAGTPHIGSMADLSGKAVAVQSGTSYAARIGRENDLLVAAGRAPITIQQYPTEDAVVQQVLIGRVFAFASQDVELYFRRKQLHGKVNIILEPDYPEYRNFAIYIRKNAHDRQSVESAIATLETSGTIAEIRKKWAIGDSGRDAFTQPRRHRASAGRRSCPRWDRAHFCAARSLR
ncbi:transporter substrate-binding domain-containing protein [Komagataeibacter kakiaceti]|uniref:transporter substrate-binding domain-containing protein n=1 Tax=Komagataeibacter kakiaceti TaxID=943261 RepID=UPI000B30D1CA